MLSTFSPTSSVTAKLLFVKNQRNETCARSAIVGETGFYWRSFENEEDLEATLRKERFMLVLVDHREGDGDVLAYVETLRKSQADANVFLICHKLELPSIVRAIRLGVRDLFHPPLEFRAIVERILTLLPAVAGSNRELHMEEWGELAVFLSEKAPAAAKSARNGADHLGSNGGSDVQVVTLRTERDDLIRERDILKEDLLRINEERAHLENEVARLSPLTEQEAQYQAELTRMQGEQEQMQAYLAQLQAEITRLQEVEFTLKNELAQTQQQNADTGPAGQGTNCRA